MKKALLIASCGLVLALIIGSTSNHKEPAQLYYDKCSDTICIDSAQGKTSEVFLRELRKTRKLLA